MTELVERLRQIAGFGNICPSEQHFLREAAAEIERLAARVAELEALDRPVTGPVHVANKTK